MIPQPEEGPSRETRLDLYESLSALPEQERRLIKLRYFQGLTQSQTASELGMTQVQVCRLEKKILKTMRHQIL